MKYLLFLLSLLFASFSVLASVSAQTGETIYIPHHKSTHINLTSAAGRVSLGDPEVLDIVILKSDELFLIGKKLGSTNLMVWNKRGVLIEALNIEVTHDLNTLKAKLYEFLPDEDISVHSSKNKLILSGMVSNQATMNLALKVAESYAGGEEADADTEVQVNTSSIINLMTIGGSQQVMLEVTVAEVQRSLTKRFDANFNFFQTSGNFGWGGGSDAGGVSGITPVFNTPVYPETGLLGSFVDGNTLFEFALDIAKENGSAKVLAEPNLTALSGTKAKFLAGGEYPIPVPDGDGRIVIEYREYGVSVEFVPTILSNKQINLAMVVGVSELSSTNALTLDFGLDSQFFVPSLTTRNASTTIELADGQTIGIAGLLSEQTREVIATMPGFSDIPVLGPLFNSQEFVSGETELVILVTPRLATPVDRSNLTLPTDGFVAPNDWEFYLLGKGSGYRDLPSVEPEIETNISLPPSTEKGGSEGKFGHSL